MDEPGMRRCPKAFPVSEVDLRVDLAALVDCRVAAAIPVTSGPGSNVGLDHRVGHPLPLGRVHGASGWSEGTGG